MTYTRSLFMSKVIQNNFTPKVNIIKMRLYDWTHNYSGISILYITPYKNEKLVIILVPDFFGWNSLLRKDEVSLPIGSECQERTGADDLEHLFCSIQRYMFYGRREPCRPRWNIPWRLCGWVTKHTGVLRCHSEQIRCNLWLWALLLCQG